MAAIDRFVLLVRDLRRGERGMALPVALFAMVSAMALAGAAVVATTNVQSGATRDDSSKSALAAADAGANVARARQAHYAFVLNPTSPCLVMASGKLQKGLSEQVGGQGWCPAVSGSTNEGQYTYRVSPVGTSCGGEELCVVSTGTVGGVSRRIEVTFKRSGIATNATEQAGDEGRKQILETWKEEQVALTNQEWEKATKKKEELVKKLEESAKAVGSEGFIGRDGITISGNADIRVGTGTNGNIETSASSSICGNIRYGIGKKWIKSGSAKQCSGFKTSEGNVNLPSVSSFIPSNIATVNSNARITTCTATNVPVNCQKDGYTNSWTKQPPFNATKREISLSGNDILTVGGGDYWVCAINLSGTSQIIMAQGSRVRFFFDTPEHCNGNTNQLSFSGNQQVSATGYQPQVGQFQMPGFYFLGNAAGTSTINLSGNSQTNEAVIYAPDSQINLSGNSTWKGIIVGRRIAMTGSATVMQDAGFQPPTELVPTNLEQEIRELEALLEKWKTEGRTPTEILHKLEVEIQTKIAGDHAKTNSAGIYFTPQSYFECVGLAPTGSAPNANC
jgi:lipopolysaccharide export system protein LptA